VLIVLPSLVPFIAGWLMELQARSEAAKARGGLASGKNLSRACIASVICAFVEALSIIPAVAIKR